MGKTLEDITLYSKTIVDAQPWSLDPKMLPLPWRQVEPKKKLKIAVLWNDGICLPTPPVTRALKETTECLRKAGHEIVEWDPKLHYKALELLGRMFVADGGKSVEALLAPTSEPYRPEMTQYKEAKELGVLDMWKLHLERSELQRQYLEQWMSYGDLDAILGKISGFLQLPVRAADARQHLPRHTRAYRMVNSNTLVTQAYTMSWTTPRCPSQQA